MITGNMYITEEDYIAGPKIDKSGVGGAMTMLDKHAGEISIVSGDMMDAEMKHRLEQFDKEQVKAILESKNIVQAYNDFLDLKINKVVNLTEKDFEDAPFIFKSFKQSYDQFKTLEEVDEQYDTKKIIDGFTYQSQDPKFIRALLETRLQYANTTQKLLKKIIENNAKFLKISSAQLQTMISSSSPKNIKDMKDAIAKNEKEFIKNKYLADCRSIGAGVLITGKEFEIGSDKVKFEDYIQDLCNFDLVVLAHGSNSVYSPGAEKQLVERVKNKLKAAGVTNTAKYDLINKKSKEAMLKGQMPELTKDEEEYVNKVSELVDDKVIGDFGKSRKDDKWEFSYPIIFVDGKRYVNIENFIRAAKKQGFKKIKLYSCNPGSYDLPADIKAGVVFSKRTNYLETTFVKDYEVAENLYLEGVFELEELARQLCEENGIDYNDDKYLTECMNYFEENKEFITEGLISTALGKLVEICKTIIGAIVGFIKKIAGMIAGLIRKIAEFIKGKDQRKIKNTDVEVNTITLETAKLKKTKVHSQQELYKVVETDLNNAAKEYRKVASKQAQINKQLQQQLEMAAKKEEKNESTILYDDGTVFEDIINNFF